MDAETKTKKWIGVEKSSPLSDTIVEVLYDDGEEDICKFVKGS